MSEMMITREVAEAALLGGAVLGGGGGGSMAKGRLNVEEALSAGPLRLVDIDDVPPDAVLVTGSAVGAPAAVEAQVAPKDYMRVVEMLIANGCPKPGGFIPNECGGSSITNGWIPAALMGLPVVDALCNGRAHPTGTMGSMGLHRDPSYVSRQAAAGGAPEKGLYLEMYVSGKLEMTASMIRTAADKTGGLVAVARNPVEAAFAKQYGACGALKQAVRLGRRMMEASSRGGGNVVSEAVDFLGGTVVARGEVTELEIVTRGGFDTGRIVIGDCETTFWNEFMTLERGTERIGTFPDLIMTLNAADGLPVTTAELRKGQDVFLIHVPAEKLLLGEGMRCLDLMRSIESVVGKEIVRYIKGELR